MISMLFKGAPISFILLFLGVYVGGAFLYFLFSLRAENFPTLKSESALQDCSEENFDERLNFFIPQISSIFKHLQFLRLIVNIAPLLGLLGTILGIVKSTGGLVLHDQNVLLLGISQSLVTTALGLIVSIPALLVHFFGKARLENRIFQIKRQLFESRMVK